MLKRDMDTETNNGFTSVEGVTLLNVTMFDKVDDLVSESILKSPSVKCARSTDSEHDTDDIRVGVLVIDQVYQTAAIRRFSGPDLKTRTCWLSVDDVSFETMTIS